MVVVCPTKRRLSVLYVQVSGRSQHERCLQTAPVRAESVRKGTESWRKIWSRCLTVKSVGTLEVSPPTEFEKVAPSFVVDDFVCRRLYSGVPLRSAGFDFPGKQRGIASSSGTTGSLSELHIGCSVGQKTQVNLSNSKPTIEEERGTLLE